MKKFPGITFDATIMGGQACIRGMRIPVSMVLNLLAHGMKEKDILKEYPDLEKEDIHVCLDYAAWLAKDELHLTEV